MPEGKPGPGGEPATAPEVPLVVGNAAASDEFRGNVCDAARRRLLRMLDIPLVGEPSGEGLNEEVPGLCAPEGEYIEPPEEGEFEST